MGVTSSDLRHGTEPVTDPKLRAILQAAAHKVFRIIPPKPKRPKRRKRSP